VACQPSEACRSRGWLGVCMVARLGGPGSTAYIGGGSVLSLIDLFFDSTGAYSPSLCAFSLWTLQILFQSIT